ncbi:sensor histidine kinase [Aureimonas sp. AU40]|uniref:sensor histidine kinase n=1 Tax=Aureimonas sp. AU40 TaxID=1637747 RepID=UPI000785BC4E|nr:PAS domain S-box protein [Aureimonas sp. AU40]
MSASAAPDLPSSLSDEAARSAALHSYEALDTPREPEFDDLARIAAEVCGTPIAVVNLVDTKRQFFKAEVGLGVRETPLETSFCGQAILAEDFMMVPDARQDPRFECSPLVQGEPGLRFYAGALLKTKAGLAIGTMCVLGYEPKELDGHQIRTLHLLARQAMTQLELRKALVERERALSASRAAEAEFRAMTEDAPAILWVTDPEARCIFLNRAWYSVTGQSREEAEGSGWLDAMHPDDLADARRVLLSANARQEPFSMEYRLRSRDGSFRSAINSGTPRFGADGTFLGYVGAVIDIDELRRAEQMQQVAMRELSHRMKNGLAMVQAIVSQSFRHATSLEHASESITSRIAALARAQDTLVRPDLTDSTVEEVVGKALTPHVDNEQRVDVAGPHVTLSSERALGLALALHELATNAAKYGALSISEGHVRITWEHQDGQFRFEWRELNGPLVATPETMGFGSRLLERVVPAYFGGRAERSFAPTGLTYVLTGEIQPAD